MTDRSPQAFERRLAAALLDYVDDVGAMPDPFERAREIARAHPRRKWQAQALPFGLRPTWLVAALLLAALLGGLLVAGSRLLRTTPQIVPAQIPGELFGRWSNKPGDDPYIDLNGSTLLRSANGETPDIGRAIGFAWDPEGSLEAVIRFDGAADCAAGRYRLVAHRAGSGGEGGPTPAAGPPDTGPVVIDSIRFTEPEDPCARRADVLASGIWRPVTRTLIGGGGAYDSLDFTEPFDLTLPADVTSAGNAVGTLRQPKAHTRLTLSHPYWNGFFLDDEPVNRDVCDPSAGTLPELPSDLGGVREWLAAAAPPALQGPTEVVVDGRTALRWKNNLACDDTFPAYAPGVYGDVVYAIPTGDDVILWAFRFDTADEEALGDAVAASLHFR
jgi:hypothetical protein